jgi:hypothetical protein
MACVLHLGGEERERERERERLRRMGKITAMREPWRGGDGRKGSECKGGCECGDESGMTLCVAVCVKVVLLVSLASPSIWDGIKAAELL